jgi:carotenoid 1,2-hydratase
MTERSRAALSRDKASITIGPSAASWNGRFLTFEIDETTSFIPSRLKGVVRVYPMDWNDDALGLDPDGQHHWWPISPRARIEVAFERPAVRWNGTGYLDSNFGNVPLETSFSNWNWSRAHVNDEAVILYDVTNRDGAATSLALRFDSAGRIVEMDPLPLHRLPMGLWGVARSTRADPGATVRIVRKLEDAPFYTRSVISSQLLGTQVEAVHESLSLDRFDTRWVQALLPFRMPRRVMR